MMTSAVGNWDLDSAVRATESAVGRVRGTEMASQEVLSGGEDLDALCRW